MSRLVCKFWFRMFLKDLCLVGLNLIWIFWFFERYSLFWMFLENILLYSGWKFWVSLAILLFLFCLLFRFLCFFLFFWFFITFDFAFFKLNFVLFRSFFFFKDFGLKFLFYIFIICYYVGSFIFWGSYYVRSIIFWGSECNVFYFVG